MSPSRGGTSTREPHTEECEPCWEPANPAKRLQKTHTFRNAGVRIRAILITVSRIRRG
jgi:hypothetical protein